MGRRERYHYQYNRSAVGSKPPTENTAGADTSGSRGPDVLVRLEQAVGAIHDSDTFRNFLTIQSRFHNYSFSNVALILAQLPDATQVAGYRRWLELHRHVRRGEKAIKIIVPMGKRALGEDGDEVDKLFFGTGNVFDVSQTEGEPLPVIDVPILQGREGKKLYTNLEQVAVRNGVSVQRDASSLPAEAMGAYWRKERRIAIRPAAPLQETKTLAHELGHHFSGIDSSSEENETIAESVAYVVLSHFGLDSGERSFPYIAVWSKRPDVLKGVLGTIQKVSATIIDGLDAPSPRP
jgi:hypothetical protein